MVKFEKIANIPFKASKKLRVFLAKCVNNRGGEAKGSTTLQEMTVTPGRGNLRRFYFYSNVMLMKSTKKTTRYTIKMQEKIFIFYSEDVNPRGYRSRASCIKY